MKAQEFHLHTTPPGAAKDSRTHPPAVRQDGRQVLVIIGGSHKAFRGSLLNQAMDVRPVPVEAVPDAD